MEKNKQTKTTNKRKLSRNPTGSPVQPQSITSLLMLKIWRFRVFLIGPTIPPVVWIFNHILPRIITRALIRMLRLYHVKLQSFKPVQGPLGGRANPESFSGSTPVGSTLRWPDTKTRSFSRTWHDTEWARTPSNTTGIVRGVLAPPFRREITVAARCLPSASDSNRMGSPTRPIRFTKLVTFAWYGISPGLGHTPVSASVCFRILCEKVVDGGAEGFWALGLAGFWLTLRVGSHCWRAAVWGRRLRRRVTGVLEEDIRCDDIFALARRFMAEDFGSGVDLSFSLIRFKQDGSNRIKIK
ncbi:2'-deoxycytidine 5'-triphosphate deaminase [Striga asiatica]|uniref:2'-deoxycytidine 5'-triphosphate deaminase n=1 Tax=Striga asiatica TaxID=4170 RepID=A0A5A7R9Q2_STRAF|nr:2'-deoxycytidine 5'-triphosphate deaminase [Striga asiatica]